MVCSGAGFFTLPQNQNTLLRPSNAFESKPTAHGHTILVVDQGGFDGAAC
jgi:hypothetical protein